MICPPYSLSRPDRYGRLLPAFQYPGNPEKVAIRLRDLSSSMFPKTHEIRADRRESIPAGYTYFGQFITHDLTFDDTPFGSAGIQDPEETVNYRTPRLDLDSLYGDGPGSPKHGHLYKGIYFRLGKAYSPSQPVFDVPLINGLPTVADSRNCENAILRQIHAMFLMLHNVAVRDIPGSVPIVKRFEIARTRVRHQFQWMVRNDFLSSVCKRQVCDAVVGSGRLIHWPAGRFSIPVEFSQAAARFGHSMVRGEYRLRKGGRRVPLEELFGSSAQPGALAPDMAVDWGRFVRPRGEVAMEIDTHLVNPLRNLPDESIRLFVSSPPPHGPNVLAERTLCRGAATRLPTGQQVRVALQSDATIPVKGHAWEVLRSLGFENETPLWYYILLEAEINESGRSLGIIGSRILAEVIEGALRHDLDSFLFQEGGEQMPRFWRVPGHPDIRIRNLHHLAIVVGLE